MRLVPEVTRWLGIWLGSALTLQKNRRRKISIGKTGQAKAKTRRTLNQYGSRKRRRGTSRCP